MSTFDEEISKAIGAHGMWKRRLHDAISSGRSEFTVTRVAADNLCDFGRWLYGLSATERASADWRRVQQLHAVFHSEASSVLSAALGGNKSEAERRMGATGAFAKASVDLTGAMMQWRSRKA